jgi:hypothetical protein
MAVFDLSVLAIEPFRSADRVLYVIAYDGLQPSRHLSPSNFLQVLLQNLARGILGDRVYEAHAAGQLFVSRQSFPHVALQFAFSQATAWFEHNVRSGRFGSLFAGFGEVVLAGCATGGYAYHGCVADVPVREEHAFELGGGDLEAADFDEFLRGVSGAWTLSGRGTLLERKRRIIRYLLSIDDIPESIVPAPHSDVTGVEISISVPALRVRTRVVVVSFYYQRASCTQLPTNIVVGDIVPFVINELRIHVWQETAYRACWVMFWVMHHGCDATGFAHAPDLVERRIVPQQCFVACLRPCG